jgi:hypothetical protein
MSIAAAAMFIIGGSGFYQAIFSDLASRDQQIADGQTIADADSKSDAEKRWIFTTNWSLPPAETLEFLVPRINGDTSCPMTLMAGTKYRSGVKPYTGALGRPYGADAGNYRQHSLYVGWVTCLLALVGAVAAFIRKDKTVIFFFVCGAVFCLFSFGRYCEMVYRCVYAMPFGDYLRAPVKWHHLTEFCFAVMAGFGIEAALRRFAASGRTSGLAKAAAVLLVLVGAADLARNAKFYCAPVNVGEARRQGAVMRMTFIRQKDLGDPQVVELMRLKRVVLLSAANRDPVLAGVLEDCRRNTEPFPPLSPQAYLSMLAMFGTVCIGFYAVKKC